MTIYMRVRSSKKEGKANGLENILSELMTGNVLNLELVSTSMRAKVTGPQKAIIRKYPCDTRCYSDTFKRKT